MMHNTNINQNSEDHGFFINPDVLTNCGVILKEANMMYFLLANIFTVHESVHEPEKFEKMMKKDPLFMKHRKEEIRPKLMMNDYKTNMKKVRECVFIADDFYTPIEKALKNSQYVIREMFVDIPKMKKLSDDPHCLDAYLEDTIQTLTSVNDCLFTMSDVLDRLLDGVDNWEKKKNG